MKLRIVALGGRGEPPADALIDAGDTIVGFGPVSERRATDLRHERAADVPRSFAQRTVLASAIEAFARVNPIFRTIALGAALFYAIALVFFHFALQLTWPGSAFDVVQAMTSTGFGDTSVVRRGLAVIAGAMIVMIGGPFSPASSSATSAPRSRARSGRRSRGCGGFGRAATSSFAAAAASAALS
ncbi:MAG TPA: hypothetical protein VIJ64_09565 [Candidatus Lustribacter sp.]